MTSREKFLNLGICVVLMLSVVLVLILLLSSSCGAPQLEVPVLRNVSIIAPDSMEIKIDGIVQGYGACTGILVENYPNFLEIGSWEFVLFPACDYDSISVVGSPEEK